MAMTQIWEGSYQAKSVTGFVRRFDGHVFPPGLKYIGLFDHIGQTIGGFDDPRTTGDMKDCYYIDRNTTSMYRAFAGAKFGGPCIIEIGELPYPRKANGDLILSPDVPEIDCSSMFANSDIILQPWMLTACHPAVARANSMFANCRHLRYLTPQELRPLGLSDVKDPAAPRILRSNSANHPAMFIQFRPKTMRYFMRNCENYNGAGVNNISLRNIEEPDGAEGIFQGCRFEKPYLDGFIAATHFEFFNRKLFKGPLTGVNLGHGRLVGQAATQYHELREHGIEVIVEQP